MFEETMFNNDMDQDTSSDYANHYLPSSYDVTFLIVDGTRDPRYQATLDSRNIRPTVSSPNASQPSSNFTKLNSLEQSSTQNQSGNWSLLY